MVSIEFIAVKPSVGEELTPLKAVLHYINTNYLSNKNFNKQVLFRHDRVGIPGN